MYRLRFVYSDGTDDFDYWDEIETFEPGSQFVPVPGTLQYGNLVKVVNKEDFES